MNNLDLLEKAINVHFSMKSKEYLDLDEIKSQFLLDDEDNGNNNFNNYT
jgi:hypothetical protein